MRRTLLLAAFVVAVCPAIGADVQPVPPAEPDTQADATPAETPPPAIDAAAVERATRLLSIATETLKAVPSSSAPPRTRMRVAEGLALIAAGHAQLDQDVQAEARLREARELMATLKDDPAAAGQVGQAVVEAHLAMDQLREALVTAESITSEAHAAHVWGAIAAAQWKAGDHDAAGASLTLAVQRADVLEDPNEGGPPPSDRARTYIAARQIEVGHLANATEVISKMVDANEEAHALAVVAGVLARHGHDNPARKVLQQSILITNTINGGLWKWVSPWVARTHARLGDMEAAAQSATAGDLPLAAIFVAQAHALRGDRTEAAPWIKQARERLDAIEAAFAAHSQGPLNPTEWLWDEHDMAMGRVLVDDAATFQAWLDAQSQPLVRAYMALGGAEALIEHAAPAEPLTIVRSATPIAPTAPDDRARDGERRRPPRNGRSGGRRPRPSE